MAVQDLPDLDLGLEESYCPYSGNITLTPLPSGGVLTGDLLNGYELEHIGVAPGTYSVSYIYTDSNGCMNTEYQEYIIAETINPSFNYEILCNELSFESSTFDPMDDYLYSWYLDDDLIVGVSQFTVSFYQNGTYNLGLTVSDIYGCVYSVSDSISLQHELDLNGFFIPNVHE